MAEITELRTLRRTKGRASPAPSERGDNKAAIFFLAPWFIGLAVITVGPVVASLYLSFTDYNLLENPN